METAITNQNVNVNDVNFMKQYLKDVYNLEKEKNSSLQAAQNLYDKIKALGKPKQIEIKGSSNRSYVGKAFGVGILLAVLGLIVGAFIGFMSASILSVIICPVLGVIIGFCYGYLKTKDNVKHANYEYNKSVAEMEADKKRVEQEEALIPKYRDTAKLYLQNCNTCEDTLKQLYSLDIIFPKYRNLVAISQIYEYYMSGRCSQLEGHEGAYNIFESEVRQNIIISQLNVAINYLAQIQQNQYMLYEALQEANSRLAVIENNTEAIKYNTAVIAENTAICARYADSKPN